MPRARARPFVHAAHATTCRARSLARSLARSCVPHSTHACSPPAGSAAAPASTYHRALHCLADLRTMSDAMRAHWFLPYFMTAALRISSSVFFHTPPASAHSARAHAGGSVSGAR